MGNSDSKGVYVQTISDNVMSIYENLPKIDNKTQDNRLSILKSSNVRPRALIRSLENYIADCQCSQLKLDIQNVICTIEEMNIGGETRLFICHNKENLDTKLEFVCAAVRLYKNKNGEEACDFCLATYTHAKTVDAGKAALGIGTIGAAIGFGAMAIATGGVGGLIIGGIGGIVGLTGGIVTKKGFDTTITDDLKNMLEANFLYELVN